MWNRKDLKERAKIAFKANYWKCILVAIIMVVAGYLSYKITSSANKQGKTVGCGSCGKGALPLHPSKKDFEKH